MWVAVAFAKATHIFFSKNNCELGTVFTKAVNILTTNDALNKWAQLNNLNQTLHLGSLGDSLLNLCRFVWRSLQK